MPISSARVSALVYKPFTGTTFHIGYARYFTPPYQAQAYSANIALFTNTTAQPDVPLADPVKPERSNYYDVGVDQVLLPGLTMGVDAYYKQATDMIDDGQFGSAVVLTQFNYAEGFSEGGEFKLKYTSSNFKAYANFAYNITEGKDVVSNRLSHRRRRLQLFAHALALHRRHAAYDRLGGCLVPLEGYALHHQHDLRQRPAHRRFGTCTARCA